MNASHSVCSSKYRPQIVGHLFSRLVLMRIFWILVVATTDYAYCLRFHCKWHFQAPDRCCTRPWISKSYRGQRCNSMQWTFVSLDCIHFKFHTQTQKRRSVRSVAFPSNPIIWFSSWSNSEIIYRRWTYRATNYAQSNFCPPKQKNFFLLK